MLAYARTETIEVRWYKGKLLIVSLTNGSDHRLGRHGLTPDELVELLMAWRDHYVPSEARERIAGV